jgi:O-acetyl-ADP-ribose deacetylase (regulator of RNase III)
MTYRLNTFVHEIPFFFQADVIVNTTHPSLDLRSGAVSKSILDKAGQGLQDECNSKYPDGIKVGDVVNTQGHGLKCKAVFHTTLPPWSGGGKEVHCILWVLGYVAFYSYEVFLNTSCKLKQIH